MSSAVSVEWISWFFPLSQGFRRTLLWPFPQVEWDAKAVPHAGLLPGTQEQSLDMVRRSFLCAGRNTLQPFSHKEP